MRLFASGGFVMAVLLIVSLAAAEGGDEPGLIIAFEPAGQAAAGHALSDARVSRLAALYVPAASAASASLHSGPFRATFSGDLNLKLRTYVHFSAEGRGQLTLSMNGATVLQLTGDDWSKSPSNEIRLSKGKNHLVAVYQSPSDGNASLRIFWSARSFLPEPLPPALLSHSSADPTLSKSDQLRQGQTLFAQLRCIRCHTDPTLTAAGDAMPELQRDAPALSDLGSRLNQDWLVAWINNPRSLRPTAHMPRLFKATGVDPRARDIAAYLASLSSADAREQPPGNAEAGGRIYANLDCIGCHTPPDVTDDPARISHKYLLTKFKPAALRQYLLDPEAHFQWNPMPNFHLSPGEAADLSAFLLAGGAKLDHPAGTGNPGRGKLLLASSGCLNCHQLSHEKSTLSAPPLAQLANASLNKGCLFPSDSHGSAPDFALTEDQRSALVAFLSTDRSALSRSCASEFAQRQIAELRCIACHARDGDESLLAQSLDAEVQSLRQKYPNPPPGAGELFAAEQRLPSLTWAGEKLRPEWMARFIAGQIDDKPRYFLHARMPGFGVRGKLLAEGLAEQHGCPPSLPPIPKPGPQLAEEGRKLCSKVPNVGFSCVQCHAVADVPPFAPFEAPSINFQYVSQRLRQDYYLRWMHDPLRIDPASKMPRFDDTDGKTGLAAFGNDATAQFEAIWQYLLEGPQIRPPQ